MNTIKRHHEQLTEILKFLGKAKFTTAKHLQLVAQRNRRGLPVQLMELGLLVRRELTSSLTIYGLSKKSADIAGVKKFDIHKVGLSRVEHALVAQSHTLSVFDEYQIEDYIFEPQIFSKDTRPDIVWNLKSGKRFFVEIELSVKSIIDGDMDRFFLKLISRETIVVFRESELLKRYLQHAYRYSKNGIPHWESVDKQWHKTGRIINVGRNTWDLVFFCQYPCHGIMSLNEYFDETM